MKVYAGEDVQQNTHLLMVGVQTCIATMEINMMVFQSIGNPAVPLRYVHSSFIHNSQNLETGEE